MSHAIVTLSMVLALMLIVKPALSTDTLLFGGYFSWAPKTPTAIAPPVTIVWTYNFFYDKNQVSCKNALEVVLKTAIGNGDFRTSCTNFNSDGWSLGTKTSEQAISSTVTQSSLSACCWPANIKSVYMPSNTGYSFAYKVDITPRGTKINSSPSLPSSFVAFMKFRMSCMNPRNVILPVTDADGDVIKCRCTDNTCMTGIEQNLSFWPNI